MCEGEWGCECVCEGVCCRLICTAVSAVTAVTAFLYLLNSLFMHSLCECAPLLGWAK